MCGIAGVAGVAPESDVDRMLEVLVCPLTQASLSYNAESQELISKPAKLAFPIRGGIPVMLVDEARNLED